jgi:hypothetical protein
LEKKLAELRKLQPCRTSRAQDTDTSSRLQGPKQHRSTRRSDRSVPNRKAAR